MKAVPGFEPRSGHVGFVVDKVALRQIFSEYFGFPCQFSVHRLLHTHHHLSSGAVKTGQIVADVPNGLSLTPPHPKKLLKKTSSDGIATGWIARVLFPAVQDFVSFHSAQTGSGVHPASYPMGTGGSSPLGKAAGV
jgi:hypothetical protein